jgi:hypothetical protein
MKGLENLPKIILKKPYMHKPLNEHAMLTKGALHIKGASELMHPASAAMSNHISSGFFKSDSKGWGNK